MSQPAGRPAILLSTFNGAHFLPDQLDSLLRQSVPDWVLFWRDDGSTDDTAALMERFMAGPGTGRCRAVAAPAGRLGATGSFMALLRAAVDAGAGTVAFADQDDVWLPDKLQLALTALAAEAEPALYCSRQVLVDAGLNRIGVSAGLQRSPDFPAALTQNIATGCTVALNAAGARLVAGSAPPPSSLHDWWSYLLVSAHGGRLLVDETPTVLYRQHGGNMVGAPRSMQHRAVAALRRGPGVFMNVLRCNVDALLAQRHLLSPEAARTLDIVQAGLQGGMRQRLRALRLFGLERQTWPETLLFRCWFLIG